MKKLILSIPEPCHEKWEEMTPDEKGRFCGSCNKTVFDFSGMTDAQLSAFFRKPVGSVCGRLHRDQLEREVFIPKKKLPWIRYFFQITIPAFLLTLKAEAQKTSIPQQTIENGPRRLLGKVKAATNMRETKLEGLVTDNQGLPVSNATVLLHASGKGTMTDSNGFFQLNPDAFDSVIVVSAVGFEEQRVRISGSTNRVVLQEKNVRMEEVVITSYENLKCRYRTGVTAMVVYTERPKEVPLLRKITDSIAPSFSIYPNPANQNSVITLRADKLESADYVLAIFDSKGSVVKISNITIQERRQVQQLSIDNVAAGSYVLCLRNKQTGKQYTKKLVVQ